MIPPTTRDYDPHYSQWMWFDELRLITTVYQERVPLCDCNYSAEGAVKMIARELALDHGEASFETLYATHVAGVSIVIADVLGRRYDPTRSKWRLPLVLHRPLALAFR